jgi:hypothetical protein
MAIHQLPLILGAINMDGNEVNKSNPQAILQLLNRKLRFLYDHHLYRDRFRRRMRQRFENFVFMPPLMFMRVRKPHTHTCEELNNSNFTCSAMPLPSLWRELGYAAVHYYWYTSPTD